MINKTRIWSKNKDKSFIESINAIKTFNTTQRLFISIKLDQQIKKYIFHIILNAITETKFLYEP